MSKRSSKRAGRVVKYTLADGTQRVKHYPPYRQKRRRAAGETVGDVIASWERSPEWDKLGTSTQVLYQRYARPLLVIEAALIKKVKRSDLIEIRNAISKSRGPGAAIGFARVATNLFGWATEQGKIEHSPALKLRKGLAMGEIEPWAEEDAEAALGALPEHLRRVVVLALHTGQRRSDLMALTWAAYDGRSIRLVQQKTKSRLDIPASDALRAELDVWKKTATATTILTNRYGKPWRTGPNLSNQLASALRKIEGLRAGLSVHGLRKLAAARLADAGCTIHEIAAITGHRSLAMVQHYTKSADQRRNASAAIVKLQANVKL